MWLEGGSFRVLEGATGHSEWEFDALLVWRSVQPNREPSLQGATRAANTEGLSTASGTASTTV